ncbi:MAG: RidA family protein [Nocardiopsaceae bacterium]|jgi:enamine deaminase RidA (YjgF/YER057c/UK114 family)|nr:RidA family protein [Nocardiopsaceae bacterium]
MTLKLINPSNLATPSTYTHVVVATGSKLIFVAGQEPEDEHGNLVGPGDLAAQARQVFANLGGALAAAGASPVSVARITIFVVGHRPEYLPVIEEARVTLFADHKPVDTLVGVETLARPEYLIEVDAIAVIDA